MAMEAGGFFENEEELEEAGEEIDDKAPEHPKILRMQDMDPNDLPPSYSVNSDEELLLIEYVENFRRQFVHLYPDRKELLLCPRNECGLAKFICTTIRPTQLEYNELYDLEACAAFVAEHIQYEPLTDPVSLPMYVPSPTSVLMWQKGDCTDMSIVLASLLIGVGYDAYVVIGYADKTTCLADETKESLPFLSEGGRKTRNGVEAKKAAAEGEEEKEEKAYLVKERPVLDSNFVMRQDKLVRLDEDAYRKEMAPEERSREDAETAQEDELAGQRTHCWVLVRAGKREMSEDVFVEASTGKLCSTDSAAYKGIEAVFNNTNYWVDMQRLPGVQGMDFTLDDFTKWEFIFLQSALGPPARQHEEPRGNQSPLLRGAAAQDAGEEEAVHMQGTEEVREGDFILDLPPSWVNRLHIHRDDFLRRYAKLDDEVKRSKDYRRSRAELFAENSRKDGMIQRLTIFSDMARQHVQEKQEVFANRKDKLRKRVRFYRKDQQIDKDRAECLIQEYFDPGRRDALMELVERPGGKEFAFFHKATLDGMVKRVEHFKRHEEKGKPHAYQKVIETFEGHEEGLNYRSITFQPPDPDSEAPLARQQIEAPKKMTQKFDRNPELPADEDLQKITFHTGTRPPKIHLVFHYGDGRITAATRTYIAEKQANGDQFSMQEYVVDPFARPLRATEKRDEFFKLEADQKKAISEFKEAERKAHGIEEERDKEERHPELIKSLFVQLQEKKQMAANKPVEEDADAALKYDYLAPYLPKHAKSKALSKQEAQSVKDGCLKALKERLIDRAHIIETRLEEEQAALTKRQLGYQRQDKDKSSDDDEYEKYVHEAQFKIQILKQRRDRHEEIAKHKFKEMIEKLQNDPRLAVLNTT